MTDIILPSSDRLRSQDDVPTCPYKGLQPYTEQDGEYFFGRDADRDLVIANLMASRLTLLYGPSGVGKSSLLQAGVLRNLRHMAEGAFSYLAVGRAVVVYFSGWRDDPLEGLGTALRTVAYGSAPDDGPWSRVPLSVEMLKEVSERLDADVVLLLDQAEDFVTYHAGPSGDTFAAMLGRIVTTPGLRANVLIGVREDALAKLDRLEAHVPALFGNSLRLDHLDAASAREAIEQPVARYNRSVPADQQVAIEPALVEDLLRDLRTGCVSVTDSGRGRVDDDSATIETPFLQLVMTRLWAAEMDGGSRVLRRDTLAGLGGAERIVRTHLDTVMTQLTDEQQEIAASVFRHLVTPSGTKIAHTAEDLADYAGVADTEALVDVLERLAAGQERVLRPAPPPVDQPGPPRYEIFHDVMAPAVLDWRRRFVAEREQREAKQALVVAEEEHRRTRRRLMLSRLVAGLLGILLVVSIVVGVYAKRRTDEAQHQAQLAEYEQQLQRDPAASLHAALRAWNERHTPAAEAAVRTAFDADTPGTVLRGHSGTVVTSVLSRDGRTVLTSGMDGTATLFDSGSGRQIRSFRPPAQPGPRALIGAQLSPDGTFVSTTAVDGQVQLYETASGRHLGRLGTYSAQAFARWGTLDRRPVLLTWSWDGTPPRVWDAATRTAIASYGSSSAWTYGAALSPDARHVVTVGSNAVFSVWDAKSGRSLARSESAGYDAGTPVFVAGSERVAFLGRQSSYGYYYATFWDWRKGAGKFETTSSWSRQAGEMAVSPTGSMMAVALDKGVSMLNTKTGKMIGKTTEEPDWVNAVAFSDDERWLVTGGNDGRTRVWLVGQWANRPVADLLGHRGGVRSASFQPGDPWRLVTASDDGTARVWQLPNRTIMPGSYDWILDASFSPDGRHIVTAEESEIVRIYDARGKLERTWDGYSVGRPMSSARFTPDGDKVVLASGQSYAPWVWNWRADTDPVQLTASDRLLMRVAVSPDGKTAAAGDEINRVIVWDLASGKILRRLTGGAEDQFVSQTVYVPGSALIAAASTDGTVRLWGAADKPVRVIGTPGSPALRSIAVTTDGRMLVTVSADHELRLWRVSDGKLLRKIDGPNSTVSGVAFNADASMVAAGAADGAVHVWAVDDGHKITVLRRHGDAVNTVEFTPDGRGFLTASDDTTAAIFTCTTCGEFETVRRNAQDRDDRRQRS